MRDSRSKIIWLVSAMILLPGIAVVGANLATAGISQLPAYIAVLSIAVVPILLAQFNFGDITNAVFIYGAGLSTQWVTTLVSTHLWGWDIHYILHVSRIVRETGDLPLQTNAGHGSTVAIAWAASMVAEVSGLSLVSIFKWVVPLSIAILPVILFAISRRLDAGNASILSPFAFIFFYRFFKVIPGKQPTAQLLLAGLLLMIPISKRSRLGVILMVLLGGGMVTAHHSTGLVALLFAAGAASLIIFLNITPVSKAPKKIRPIFVFGILSLFWILWYLHILSGRIILSAISAASYSTAQIGDTIQSILGAGEEASSGGGAARTGVSYADIIMQDPILLISALLVGTTIAIASFGVIIYWTKRVSGEETDDVLLGFGISGIIFGVIGLISSLGMGFDRVASYVLLVIAPFIALVPAGIERGLSRININVSDKTIQCSIVLLLSIMFIFGSGLAYIPVGEQPPEYALGVNSESYWQTYEQDEVAAARWTSEYFDQTAAYLPPGPINNRDGLLLVEQFYPERISKISPGQATADCESFFQTQRPWRDGSGADGWLNPAKTIFFENNLNHQNRVYHSGKAVVYEC